jgi:ectoine hydroxylase-related dioxygenase (phytanoyl-CoA dioxygenase family)
MNKVVNSSHTKHIQALSEFGYTIIDFLNQDELTTLLNQTQRDLNKLNLNFTNGIHMTTWIADNNLKYSVKKEIEQNIKLPCDRIFENYQLSNPTYIIKKKHKVSNFPVHQDWSFVDETKNEALNLWIALQDTNEHNGGLQVIKGSHRLKNYIRPTNCPSNFENFSDKLNKFLTPINLKAGQAILFYYSIIHGSTSNHSIKPRMIISATVLPKHAEIILNYYDREFNQLKQYKMPNDFLYALNDVRNSAKEEPQNGILFNSIEAYQPQSITYDAIEKTAIVKKQSLIAKILHKFQML